MSSKSLGKIWISIGVISLLISGLLSIVVTGAKMPMVKAFVDIELIRWLLVIHVNLANLVWFVTIPVGLTHLAFAQDGNKKSNNSWAIFGIALSILGILLMVLILPTSKAEPILSNYIPVIAHPQHDVGLFLFLCGVLATYLQPNWWLPKMKNNIVNTFDYLLLDQIEFGLWAGRALFFLAVLTLTLSFAFLKGTVFFERKVFYEVSMWGGGHLLQHSSVVFLVTIWAYLLNSTQSKKQPIQLLWHRKDLFPVFAYLSIPIFVTPILLFYSPETSFYRDGFTLMMQWCIAPAILYFIYRTYRLTTFELNKNLSRIAVNFSFILIILGIIYGALIRGPDLRVPGHYHATIGAITIGFMYFSHQILSKQMSQWLKWAIWLYGLGQIIFSTGMFTAGLFGVGRKTYGAEHVLTHWGQYLGFTFIAVGGLTALMGGLFFTISIISSGKGNRELSIQVTSA